MEFVNLDPRTQELAHLAILSQFAAIHGWNPTVTVDGVPAQTVDFTSDDDVPRMVSMDFEAFDTHFAISLQGDEDLPGEIEVAELEISAELGSFAEVDYLESGLAALKEKNVDFSGGNGQGIFEIISSNSGESTHASLWLYVPLVNFGSNFTNLLNQHFSSFLVALSAFKEETWEYFDTPRSKILGDVLQAALGCGRRLFQLNEKFYFESDLVTEHSQKSADEGQVGESGGKYSLATSNDLFVLTDGTCVDSLSYFAKAFEIAKAKLDESTSRFVQGDDIVWVTSNEVFFKNQIEQHLWRAVVHQNFQALVREGTVPVAIEA